MLPVLAHAGGVSAASLWHTVLCREMPVNFCMHSTPEDCCHLRLRCTYSLLNHALHAAGLEAVQAAAGNLARFQLIFKLTSNVDNNYLHIHTLKGILVASRVRQES